MFEIRVVLALLIAFTNMAVASGPTSIFIDQIEEYALLATCAELELSTIVRNMKWGCGDGGSFQSFACFCYESSAKFSSMIGAHVATQCPDDPSQNTTALHVFSSYCDIGGSKLAEIVAATTPITGTLLSSSFASPASTPRPAFSISTSTTLISSPVPTKPAETAPALKSTSRTVAVATGVIVPVVILASVFAAFFLFRRYKSKEKHSKPSLYEVDISAVDASKGGTCHEVSDIGQIPAELPNPDPQELDAESG